jgi:hypothetical protein
VAKLPASKMMPLLTALVLGCISVGAQVGTQKSSTLVKTDPAKQYQLVYATMEQFYRHGVLRSNIDPKSEFYDLNICDPEGYLGAVDDKEPTDETLGYLASLAEETVVWRNDFMKLGIPDDVWGPLVSSYESVVIKRGGVFEGNQGVAGRNQIVAALNKYRRQANRRLPEFTDEGGCGAGEINVNIRLLPADGQLFLIPVFLFKLCQAQHLNAADPGSCDRWTEVINGTASYVSGDYLYLARWTDGTVRCGPLGFKSVNQEGKTFQITKLRSPVCNPGW